MLLINPIIYAVLNEQKGSTVGIKNIEDFLKNSSIKTLLSDITISKVELDKKKQILDERTAFTLEAVEQKSKLNDDDKDYGIRLVKAIQKFSNIIYKLETE